MTRLEAEQILTLIVEQQAQIQAEEKERDALVDYYCQKITRAQDICEKNTREAKELVAYYTEQLRAYAAENVTEKKRSVPLPSGTLSFRKQSPKFYLDGKEFKNNDERLIAVVKQVAPEYVKVKTEEYTDWAKFKGKLLIVDDGVVFEETGEFIPDMRGKIEPDKFTVTLS